MVANLVDHTYLKTEKEGISREEQEKQIAALVQSACSRGAYSVCVREQMVAFAKTLVKELDSPVKICSVIGFPDGSAFTTEQKLALMRQARADGADEYDMVLNLEALKKGDFETVRQDVLALAKEAGDQVLKVIFEMYVLTEQEKDTACNIVFSAFAEAAGGPNQIANRFFKTSTGFAQPRQVGDQIGATLSDIELMYRHSHGLIGIKAAGGVGNVQQAINFWKAAGAPQTEDGRPDPTRFRIGSSSLLGNLDSAQIAGDSSY